MGDSEEGGGGSVQWKLEATNVTQEGKDDDGEEGTDFTVSFLKYPFSTREEFLEYLKSPQGLKLSTKDTDRVYFNLPIRRNTPAQIRVSWGTSSHHEGTSGGNPTLAVARKAAARKAAARKSDRKKPERIKR